MLPRLVFPVLMLLVLMFEVLMFDIGVGVAIVTLEFVIVTFAFDKLALRLAVLFASFPPHPKAPAAITVEIAAIASLFIDAPVSLFTGRRLAWWFVSRKLCGFHIGTCANRAHQTLLVICSRF